MLAWPLWRPAEALIWARRGASGATAGSARARAALAMAMASLAAADPNWRDHATAAAAGASDDAEARTSARLLACGRVLFREPSGSAITVGGLVEAVLSFHVNGECEVAGTALRPFSHELGPAGHDVAAAHLAVALADSGRTGEALHILNARALGRPDAGRRGSPVVGRGGGGVACRPSEKGPGRSPVLRGDSAPGIPAFALAGLVDAWSAFELGDAVPGSPIEVRHPALDAVPVELRALRALACGDAGEAESCFAVAAERWRPVHRRGELRCRWAAGEAARRAGAADRARSWLEELRANAAGLGHRPMVARARAGLRRLGVRTRPSRSIGRAGLTGREVEVLGLVAEGLTAAGSRRASVWPARPSTPRWSRLCASSARRTRVQAAAMLSVHSHA